MKCCSMVKKMEQQQDRVANVLMSDLSTSPEVTSCFDVQVAKRNKGVNESPVAVMLVLLKWLWRREEAVSIAGSVSRALWE